MQRKPSKSTRGPNAGEKRIMKFVAGLSSCQACGDYGPIEVHHVVGSAAKQKVEGYGSVIIGMAFLLALCPHCHQFVTENRKKFTYRYGRQARLWKDQMLAYAGDIPEPVRIAISMSRH